VRYQDKCAHDGVLAFEVAFLDSRRNSDKVSLLYVNVARPEPVTAASKTKMQVSLELASLLSCAESLEAVG